MPTVIFVLGLCGSGKSCIADQFMQVRVFDESFLDKKSELIAALQSGEDCVVVEIAYCQEKMRAEIIQELHASVPGVRITWLCIENDLKKANENCRRNDRKSKPDYNAEEHIGMNQLYNQWYTYPEGAIILKMWPY